MRSRSLWCLFALSTLAIRDVPAQSRVDTVGLGWSGTSINTVIFRKNSLITFEDSQYVSYYDSSGHVVVGKRSGNGPWILERTELRGNVADAHNSISMTIDGNGYIHLSWDHHNDPLHYVRSKEPGALTFQPSVMIGRDEERVSYPEFYRLPSGDLLFLYRNGASGQGNLVLNKYNYKTGAWERLHDNLIDGESERNAYWQASVSNNGTLHLSWVWREDPDVSTNHDLCYAKSTDGGKTWVKSSGEVYSLPIRDDNAEYALRISQDSDLMNQCSMSSTEDDHPVIASYWRRKGSDVPQFFIVYHNGLVWSEEQVSLRTTPFSLKGVGTRIIPISRPQVLVRGKVSRMMVQLVYRDNERGHLITVAAKSFGKRRSTWRYSDYVSVSTAIAPAWEPTYDTELFRTKGRLSIFVQDVRQGDGEKVIRSSPSPVVVMTF